MSQPFRIWFLVCIFLLVPALSFAASGSPVVYVSGSDGSISSVITSTGVVTILIPASGAVYQGIVVGPDNPGHRFFVYAFDPTHNTIIRFDPNNLGAGIDIVYAGTGAAGTLQMPESGRFTSTEDLLVNSGVPGSGVWKISGVANLPLGTAVFPAPVRIAATAATATQIGQGITQENDGDLLMVDHADNQILRAPFSSPSNFNSVAPFITSNVTNPVGIARRDSRQIYVSTQTSNGKKGSVQLFGPDGTFLTTCVPTSVFGQQAPNFLGISEDGTLYAAGAASSSGSVWSVTTDFSGRTPVCTATQLSTSVSLPPLTGIALPPTQASVNLSQASTGTLTFNYGSSLFGLTTGTCGLTLTKTLVPPTVLDAKAAGLTGSATIDGQTVTLAGGVSVPYLGDGGFATKYSTSNFPAGGGDTCSNAEFEYLIAASIDQLTFGNPWVIICDPDITGNCAATNVTGLYFLGGLLPADITTIGTGTHHSEFFAANMNLNTAAAGTLTLGSPLIAATPPNLAGTFSSNISVKFKLASPSGPITTALAVLAVAQICQPPAPGQPPSNDAICGPNGQVALLPIVIKDISPEGNSTIAPPIFKFSPTNQQYQFSLSLKGFASGIYSMSIVLLSNNTHPLTVIFQVP